MLRSFLCLQAKKTDAQLLAQFSSPTASLFKLETETDCNNAVQLRRTLWARRLRDPSQLNQPEAAKGLEELPLKPFPYSNVHGRNCENVVGFIPLPVGVAGPLLVDDFPALIPLATTEGALVASINRGCRALSEAGGVKTFPKAIGMTRAALIQLSLPKEVQELEAYCSEHLDELQQEFSKTTRIGKLVSVSVTALGRRAHFRCAATTGDAMGMNMITKGVSQVLTYLKQRFPSLTVVALSGNMCTDKKPSAINWILGRGHRVLAEAVISDEIVQKVLKTNTSALVELGVQKNLIGSALAGSIGGCNAHAANIVAAFFAATGQDLAQVVESSTSLVHYERMEQQKALCVSLRMPSLELGTVGGGTQLPAQRAALQLLNCLPTNNPGESTLRLASIVASVVLAGEISLMAGLSSGDLLSAHMKLNRKT